MSRKLISTLSPEAKMTKHLFYIDLVIWGMGLGTFFLTHPLIQHLVIKGFYGLCVFSFAIWLSIKPKRNPNKRNYQVIQFAFKRDKTVYHMFLPAEVGYFDSDEDKELDEPVMLDLTRGEESI